MQRTIPLSVRRTNWAWLGTAPFFLFALAFMFLPAWTILSGSFRDASGALTLVNLRDVFQEKILAAYSVSIQLSVVTALVGALVGTLLAYAITWGGLPRSVRSAVITFSSVASNAGGIPLAFAFITLLGRTGVMPKFLKTLGLDLYANGFSIYSLTGLIVTYIYFQFPLMVLIMAPAFDGLKREWREAAENLGGTTFDFWRRVGLPILLPSFLGATVLLFGNAFAAYATAEALTGSKVDVITRIISVQIRGDVMYNPNLSYAISLGMMVVLGVSVFLYVLLQQRTARWLR
ncbi:MAG: ABC transporter permease subunit [Chloroflexi bacterium]|nr:ABC transporter permease subunit [Chloroflexota bacterium]